MTEDWGAVLVVDDDADMRSLLCDVLQGRGHQCTGVGSGQEALQHLGGEDYAVVLTDLRMKGMLGTELLAEIKHLYPDIGVILMTAFGSVTSQANAFTLLPSERFVRRRSGVRSAVFGKKCTGSIAFTRFSGKVSRCRLSSIWSGGWPIARRMC